MILKWNNGQKKALSIQKRALRTPRYVTAFYISCFVHNLIESNTHGASDRQLIEYLNRGLQY